MATESSWSGDPLASSLLGRPSYVASFEANQPRQQRGAVSVPVADGTALPSQPSGMAPSYSSAQNTRAKRRIRDHHKPIAGSDRLRTSARPHLLQERNGAPASSRLTSSPSPSDDMTSAVKRPRLSPTMSTDQVAYTSAYAAEPSSADASGQRGALESSEDDSSSESEAFQWDKKGVRHGSLPPFQALRSLAVPSPQSWHSSISREPSPLGRKNTASPSHGNGGAGDSIPRHRRPSPSRPSRHGDDGVNTGRSPNRQGINLPEVDDGKATARSMAQTNGRLSSKPPAPTTGHCSGKGFNARTEVIVMIVTALWACWQLAHRQETIARIKAGGESHLSAAGVAICVS